MLNLTICSASKATRVSLYATYCLTGTANFNFNFIAPLSSFLSFIYFVFLLLSSLYFAFLVFLYFVFSTLHKFLVSSISTWKQKVFVKNTFNFNFIANAAPFFSFYLYVFFVFLILCIHTLYLVFSTSCFVLALCILRFLQVPVESIFYGCFAILSKELTEH